MKEYKMEKIEELKKKHNEERLASRGAGKIKSIGKLRGMVREMLKPELKKIDVLVQKILK